MSIVFKQTKKNKPQPKRTTYDESQNAQAFPSRTIVHAKLEMTEPGDYDEQEADAVADAVVSGEKIRRRISGSGGSSGIAVSQQMESHLSQLQGGGRQMPDGLRSMMETGFGRDFSQVRLHTDSDAASMSRSIQAKAFTHGNDIYFNQGQFSPESVEGQHLVAHELTHVAQGGNSVRRAPSDEDESSSQDNGFEGPYLQKRNRTPYSIYSLYTPRLFYNAPILQPQQTRDTNNTPEVKNSEVPHGEEETKPSLNDYANYYIFNLDGVLLSENSTNSLKNEVVVYFGDKSFIKTGLNMKQFLYITAVVQHEAATKGYAFEEMFAVARSIINATKDKGKKTEFDLVKPNKQFTSVDPTKKEQHIDAYKKNSNTFLGGLRQSNQGGKFPVAIKATLLAFAIKTATSEGRDITTLDKEGLSEKYKKANRWDGTDFYEAVKNGSNHPKFKENKVIIIPENILDSYYTANDPNNKTRKVADNHKHRLVNGIYYIKGNYHKGALIAVGNAGKSIFWKKVRNYQQDYQKASIEYFKGNNLI